MMIAICLTERSEIGLLATMSDYKGKQLNKYPNPRAAKEHERPRSNLELNAGWSNNNLFI
jgi:hypothetical protein